MLLHKHHTPEKGSIITIRIGGEEVIGEVEEVTEQHLLLKRPLTLMNTSQGVGFAPATLLGDPESTIMYMNAHVQAYMSSRPEIVDQYRQAVSGIAIASADSVAKQPVSS